MRYLATRSSVQVSSQRPSTRDGSQPAVRTRTVVAAGSPGNQAKIADNAYAALAKRVPLAQLGPAALTSVDLLLANHPKAVRAFDGFVRQTLFLQSVRQGFGVAAQHSHLYGRYGIEQPNLTLFSRESRAAVSAALTDRQLSKSDLSPSMRAVLTGLEAFTSAKPPDAWKAAETLRGRKGHPFPFSAYSTPIQRRIEGLALPEAAQIELSAALKLGRATYDKSPVARYSTEPRRLLPLGEVKSSFYRDADVPGAPELRFDVALTLDEYMVHLIDTRFGRG